MNFFYDLGASFLKKIVITVYAYKILFMRVSMFE